MDALLEVPTQAPFNEIIKVGRARIFFLSNMFYIYFNNFDCVYLKKEAMMVKICKPVDK